MNGPLRILLQDSNAVHTNSIASAPFLGKSPPVVVLMPGLGPSINEYSALAEDLASHGYAVVGINATGSSQVVGFPDGHLVYAASAGIIAETNIDAWYVTAARVVGVWADDAAFVVSTLAKTAPVMGSLDFSRVAYLGHSLGGNASFEICSRDTECVAAIDLDGTIFSQVRRTGLKVPGLILQATDPAACEGFCQRNRDDFKALTLAESVRDVAMDGAQHYNFTDSATSLRASASPGGPAWIDRRCARPADHSRCGPGIPRPNHAGESGVDVRSDGRTIRRTPCTLASQRPHPEAARRPRRARFRSRLWPPPCY